jgi:hypothetical protein
MSRFKLMCYPSSRSFEHQAITIHKEPALPRHSLISNSLIMNRGICWTNLKLVRPHSREHDHLQEVLCHAANAGKHLTCFRCYLAEPNLVKSDIIGVKGEPRLVHWLPLAGRSAWWQLPTEKLSSSHRIPAATTGERR